jgi:hypothetical protein
VRPRALAGVTDQGLAVWLGRVLDAIHAPMAARDEISVTLTRTEALALAKVADSGLRVVEALGLIQSPVAAKNGLAKLNGALAHGRKGT